MKKFKILLLSILFILLLALGGWAFYYFAVETQILDKDSENTVLVDNILEAEPLIIEEKPLASPAESVLESETKPVEPDEQEPKTITLMAVGDNLMHNALIRSGLQPDGTYNYDSFYEGIAEPLAKADIKVINQETILGGDNYEFQGYPRFNSPTALGDSLIRSGFNVILHASNHAADMNADGLLNCVAYWKKHPEVLMVGINDDDLSIKQPEADSDYSVGMATEAVAPVRDIPILTIEDHTFAILNYTYSPNMEIIPKSIQGHLNILCDWNKQTGAISFTKLNPEVLEDIRAARRQADVVIVFPHWGIEYQTNPSVYQKEWAQAMADAGADLIIGTHPHVCQPVEWVTAANGKKTLCYYSLGNYVSTQRDPISMLEGMAWVTFTETENGLEIVPDTSGVFSLINQYKYNPLRFDYVYFLEDYTPEIAATHGIPQWGNGRMDVDQLHKWEEEIFGDFALTKENIFSE